MPKRVPFTSHATADRMDFNDEARTITLTGHVHLTGDDPGMLGDMDATTVTVHLNTDGSIDSIEGNADPGRTVITNKSGGGRRK